MEKFTGTEKYQGIRKYNKLIEKRFFQENKIRQAVWEARNDGGANKTGGNGSGHAFVSDPTANAAMRGASLLPAVEIEVGKNETERIKWPEKWLAVIEATYRQYEDGVAANILRDRYKGETQIKTCMKNYISKATYYFILREIENYAMMCACQAGLVKVY